MVRHHRLGKKWINQGYALIETETAKNFTN